MGVCCRCRPYAAPCRRMPRSQERTYKKPNAATTQTCSNVVYHLLLRHILRPLRSVQLLSFSSLCSSSSDNRVCPGSGSRSFLRLLSILSNHPETPRFVEYKSSSSPSSSDRNDMIGARLSGESSSWSEYCDCRKLAPALVVRSMSGTRRTLALP